MVPAIQYAASASIRHRCRLGRKSVCMAAQGEERCLGDRSTVLLALAAAQVLAALRPADGRRAGTEGSTRRVATCGPSGVVRQTGWVLRGAGAECFRTR